jgi:hypothetical protein
MAGFPPVNENWKNAWEILNARRKWNSRTLGKMILSQRASRTSYAMQYYNPHNALRDPYCDPS